MLYHPSSSSCLILFGVSLVSMIHEIQIYLHQEQIMHRLRLQVVLKPRGLIEQTDPTGFHAKTSSHVCAASPDVGYCMLSESITSLSPDVSLAVCLFSCLVVVKCRSKHKGERKLIIAFDTCCEAEQLFVEGQLLSSLPFPSSNLSGFTSPTSPCQRNYLFRNAEGV